MRMILLDERRREVLADSANFYGWRPGEPRRTMASFVRAVDRKAGSEGRLYAWTERFWAGLWPGIYVYRAGGDLPLIILPQDRRAMAGLIERVVSRCEYLGFLRRIP